MKRNALVLLGVLTVVTGCTQLGFLSSDDLVQGPVEGTYYLRSPGVGTVLQEFYGYSQNEILFKMWSLELLEYSVNCPSNPCDEIIPLQINNSWIYDVNFFDSVGNTTASWIDTSFVARDTTIDGETWYILYFSGAPNAVGTNKSDGYWTRSVDSLLPGNQIVLLSDPYLGAKYPDTTGAIFDNQPGFESEILDTGLVVTVSAGTFKCYRYLRTFK